MEINPDLVRLYNAGKAAGEYIDDAITRKAASIPHNDELNTIFPSLTPAQEQRVRRQAIADLAKEYGVYPKELQVACQLVKSVDRIDLLCGYETKELLFSVAAQMAILEIISLGRFGVERLRKTIAKIRNNVSASGVQSAHGE